jgi:hypothetical protein
VLALPTLRQAELASAAWLGKLYGEARRGPFAHDAAAEKPFLALRDGAGVGIGDGRFGKCLLRAGPMYDGDRGAADESQGLQAR